MLTCERRAGRSVRCRRESPRFQKGRPYLGRSLHRRGRTLYRREVSAIDPLLRLEVALCGARRPAPRVGEPLFTNCREGAFSATELPVYGFLGNLEIHEEGSGEFVE